MLGVTEETRGREGGKEGREDGAADDDRSGYSLDSFLRSLPEGR